MAVKTINLNQIEPNTIAMLNGKVSFSRIMSRIEGEELEKDIKRQRDFGRQFAVDKPHIKIQLFDAKVLINETTGKTKFDTFLEEHMFQSSQADKPGWSYSKEFTSSKLPKIIQKSDTGNHEIEAKGELATGLDVTLVLRVFGSDKGNNGYSLDAVIINEPIKYVNTDALQKALEERGLTYTPLAKSEEKEEVVETTPEVVSEPENNAFTNEEFQTEDQGGIRWDPNNRNY